VKAAEDKYVEDAWRNPTLVWGTSFGPSVAGGDGLTTEK